MYRSGPSGRVGRRGGRGWSAREWSGGWFGPSGPADAGMTGRFRRGRLGGPARSLRQLPGGEWSGADAARPWGSGRRSGLPTVAVGPWAGSVGENAGGEARVRRGPAYWPDAVTAWSWQRRWQLAPLAGTGALAATASSPVLAATAGVLLAGAAEGTRRLANSGRQFRGRMLLSVRERRLLAAWAASSAGWLLWSAIPMLPGARNVLLLLAGTAVPVWGWVRSRWVRRDA